jgi:transcriptional regulator with XRE-family HTH domain
MQGVVDLYEDLIAERLARLREKKGVSARNMSLSIGQAAGYINAIENKQSLPSVTAFFYICEYLGVTPKEFFDDDASNPALLNELLEELRGLDDNSLRHMLGLAKTIRAKK